MWPNIHPGTLRHGFRLAQQLELRRVSRSRLISCQFPLIAEDWRLESVPNSLWVVVWP
jgi:hypothetical protein